MGRPSLRDMIKKMSKDGVGPQAGKTFSYQIPTTQWPVPDVEVEAQLDNKVVCVGGPIDGQLMANVGGQLQVNEVEKPTSFGPFTNGPPKQMIQTRTYKLREIRCDEHESLYFYVFEGMSDNDALKQLLMNYAPGGADWIEKNRQRRIDKQRAVEEQARKTKSLIDELAEVGEHQ